jgi:hypothetical protein
MPSTGCWPCWPPGAGTYASWETPSRTSCAASARVRYPPQAGGVRSETSGSNGLPGSRSCKPKGNGDNRMPLKRKGNRRRLGPCSARPARYGKGWIARTQDANGEMDHPLITAPTAQGHRDTAANRLSSERSARWVMGNDPIEGVEMGAYVALPRLTHVNAGFPKGREPYGNGASVVVRGRESRPHGEGRQVSRIAQYRRYA